MGVVILNQCIKFELVVEPISRFRLRVFVVHFSQILLFLLRTENTSSLIMLCSASWLVSLLWTLNRENLRTYSLCIAFSLRRNTIDFSSGSICFSAFCPVQIKQIECVKLFLKHLNFGLIFSKIIDVSGNCANRLQPSKTKCCIITDDLMHLVNYRIGLRLNGADWFFVWSET